MSHHLVFVFQIVMSWPQDILNFRKINPLISYISFQFKALFVSQILIGVSFFFFCQVKKQSGSLKVIVDSKLGGKFNSKSMKEVHNLALKCIDESPQNRPDIRKVVVVLRTAVETENSTLQTSSKWLRSLIGQT